MNEEQKNIHTDHGDQNENFQRENGMTLDEAWDKVREWHFSGDTDAAQRGCNIILEYFPDHPARDLLQKMQGDTETSEKKHEELSEKNQKKSSLLAGLFGSKKKKRERRKENEASPHNVAPSQEAVPVPLEETREETSGSPVLDDERLFATIAYAWIFCIIPLFLKKESGFIQFHAKQGLIMALLFTIFEFTIGAFFQVVFPFIGVIIRFAYIGLIFYAAYQAYQGKYWRIPLVYGASKKIKL